VNTHERRLLPTLSGKLWLITALFLVLLPHLLRMPLGLSLLGVGVFGWRLAHELKGWALPRRALRWLLTLLAFGAVALLFKSVVGRDAGVALLSVMLCLKLLELRTLRDALVTLYIGYFLVLGAFLFSQSLYTGGYLLLVVLLLTAALIALNHPQSSAANTRYYLRYSGQLLLQAFPLMVVLFLLFPRLDGPLWHMPQGRTGKTGLSDEIRMGTISSLVESEEVAFRVEFQGTIPAADRLYWRGPVLWQTDGRLWRRLRQPPLPAIPHFEAHSEPVSYSVTLEAGGNRRLFALDLPATLPQGLDSPALIRPDFQLLADKPLTTTQRYTISSVLNYRTTRLDDSELWAALQLPEEVNSRSLALAQGWANEGLSPEQLIARALNYFRDNDFYYSRQPPLLDRDPVDDFLFNSRRGFCEHYATSFVTLMRAAGVPARVVTGYQGGERNRLGDYLIVRQSNAHAWAEVWLDESGWRRIDPTSNIPPERVEEMVDSQRFATTDLLAGVAQNRQFNLFKKSFYQLRQMWDAVNHGWNQWVLGFDKARQERLLQALGLKEGGWGNLILLMLAALLVLVALISAIVLLQRPRQRDPVQRHYQLFCTKLAKRGVARRANEGPHDYATRAAQALPQYRESIITITRLYVALRYQQPGNGSQLAEFKRAIRKL
jgi:transglutaminase-like putative cysteine protease